VFAAADGVGSFNASVVRSTTVDLGLTRQTYAGEHVAFYLTPFIDGVDLDSLTRSFQVVEGTDLAYEAQQVGLGTTPFGGARQYLVLDVSDNEATSPCGLAANPIRLGWLFADEARRNCYVCFKQLPGGARFLRHSSLVGHLLPRDRAQLHVGLGVVRAVHFRLPGASSDLQGRARFLGGYGVMAFHCYVFAIAQWVYC